MDVQSVFPKKQIQCIGNSYSREGPSLRNYFKMAQTPSIVIPAKAGTQVCRRVLDPGACPVPRFGVRRGEGISEFWDSFLLCGLGGERLRPFEFRFWEGKSVGAHRLYSPGGSGQELPAVESADEIGYTG